MEDQPVEILTDDQEAAEPVSPGCRGANILAWLCGGSMTLLLFWLYFHWGGADYVEAVTNVVQIFVYLCGVILVYKTAMHPALSLRTKRSWLFFTLACLSYTIASLFWAYFELITKTQPFPSLADPFYLGFNLLMVCGLMLAVPKAQTREERLKLVLDAGIVTLGSAMLIWYFLLQPIAQAGGDDPLMTALSLAYPVFDLILLFGVSVVLFKGAEPHLKWAMNWLLMGTVLVFFADLMFGYQNLNGTYQTGTVADALYTVSGFFLVLAGRAGYAGCAGVRQSDFPIHKDSQLFTWLPYLAIASGYGLLLTFVYDNLQEVLSQLILLAGLLTFLVVIRQVIAIRENIKGGHALFELQERFQGIYRSSKDAIAFISFDGTLIDINDAFAELVGYNKEELLDNKTYLELTPPEYHRFNERNNKLILESNQSAQYEKEYLRKDGTRVPIAVTAFAVKGSDGHPMGLAAIIRDITERKRNESQLMHNALHDALTGLPNRALFLEHLKTAIKTRRRRHSPLFAVLFLDFDRFKVINDSLGHLEGDKLLISIARRLQATIREGDIVARLGGDEFTVLLNNLQSEADVECVVGRIEEVLREPFSLTERQVFTSASIGIAMSSTGYTKPDEMLRDADTAMYYAKEAGKAQHHFFTPAMHERANRRLQLENEMRPAIERGEFCLLYQPIVEIESRRVLGFESLVRWRHPERGLIPPAEFIPIAEETGMILPLSDWIMREACRQLRQWQRQSEENADLTVSVNLSSRQFMQNDLFDAVSSLVAEFELAPGSLHLEVTESSLLKDSESAIEIMNRLRSFGVKFSIDDFGTGYSSLSYLHQLPINYLKIDRSFVTDMKLHHDNEEIVRSILMLAQSLGIEVIAEGIETYEELEILQSLNCKYGQGYLFAQPEPPAAIESLLPTRTIPSRRAPGCQSLALYDPGGLARN